MPDTTTLLVRNMPVEAYRLLKHAAVDAHMSTNAYLVAVLVEAARASTPEGVKGKRP
jgi:hypothetical protein